MLCLSYSASNAQTTTLNPNQTYNTNNVVTQQGWVNGVYQNSLTCWGPGGPGYCGPNPIIGPSGNINFSYGTTDLYQLKSVADILPDSGNGLRVNGYNFGFTAKNGNGWDDGRVDYLIAYVKMNDSKGNESFSKIYDLNWKFDWSTFNFSETFATPYASKDLSTVRYGFVGRDNNGWAGPYGPEIYNVSFSLKYSVDPCFNNPTFSPSCPGYLDAISKYIATPTTPIIDTTASLSAPAPTTTQVQTYQPVGPNTSQPVSTTNTALPSSPTSTTGAPVVSAAPTATNPQPKVGEVQVAGSTRPASNGPSMSQLMSIVNAEQSRVQQSERMVTEQVQAIINQVTTNAESIASQAVNQSIAFGNASAAQVNTQINNISEQSSLQSTIQAAPMGLITSQQDNIPVYTAPPPITAPPSIPVISAVVPGADVNQGVSLNPLQSFDVPIIPSTPFIESPRIAYEAPVLPTFKNDVEVSTPTHRNLQDDVATKGLFIQQPITIEQVQQSITGPSVNTKAKDNEAAGTMTIASIATVPLGYETYTVFALKDTPFYPPTQVYRNQRTVDNVRNLKFMNARSDSLHEQMIKQQYKEK